MAGGYIGEETFTEDQTQKTAPAEVPVDSPCGQVNKQQPEEV